MLLGVYGMYSTGKTTFLSQFKDELADASVHGNLIVVLADLAMEYWFDPDEDVWISNYDKPKYKGTRADKFAHIETMIKDEEALWIVESARYFGGLHEHFVDCYKRYRGGLRFIVPVTTAGTGKRFLMDRCIKRNKTFRADYWTTERLNYECLDRYLNPMKRLYEPAGVMYHAKIIDYERTAWDAIGEVLLRWVALPASKWYYSEAISEHARKKLIEGDWSKHEDLPNKGHERERQDHNSQAIVTRVPRR